MTDKSTVGGIALIVLAVLGFFVVAQAGLIPGWPLPSGSGTPTPTPSGGGSVYCAATGQLATATSPPQGCSSNAIVLKILPMDLYAQTSVAASTYSVKFYINVAGAWQPTADVVACGTAPTSCTSKNTYTPGQGVGVSLCKNQTPSCTSVDYAAQKTRIDCLLPSVTATVSTGGVCGQSGPGAGVVPFGPSSCESPPCTVTFTMPVVLMAGAAYANNSPDQIQITWQNATTFTSSNTCFVLSGSKQCDLPTATSQGKFAVNFQVQTGAAGGTAPAAPYGAGYASFTPFDPALQQNAGTTQARGSLNLALVVEIKATTGTDMCFPGSLTVAGNTILPTQVANGNTGTTTDIFYVYILPDSSLTRIVDASGGVVSAGTLQSQFSVDCGKVYNGGSTDVVALTYNVYTYFSLSYFTKTFGTLNPEVPVNSSSGLATNNVITIKQ